LPVPVAPCPAAASSKAAVVLLAPTASMSMTQASLVLGQQIYALQAVRNLLPLSSREATLAPKIVLLMVWLSSILDIVAA